MARTLPQTRAADVAALAGWLLIGFLPSIGGIWTRPGAWYASLEKPPWNPPPEVFGPVWTLLYASIGISAWLLWRRTGLRGAPVAFTLFGIQLLLNAIWSPVFFGAQRLDLGLVVIVALWLAIAATLVAFSRHHRLAGALLGPYFLWVSFATALNYTLWQLNR